MWDSFRFDPVGQEITVWEPKFTNNTDGLAYQPRVSTELPNFFFAAIRPATSFVEVKGFINREWLVEVEADCVADR